MVKRENFVDYQVNIECTIIQEKKDVDFIILSIILLQNINTTQKHHTNLKKIFE
jgi:hypothetical protein